MNDNEKPSSSQMNTTHFHNQNNNEIDKLNNRRINNNVLKNNIPGALNSGNLPHLNDLNTLTPSNSIPNKQNEKPNLNDNKLNKGLKNTNSEINLPNKKTGRSGIADNLRNSLNTIPSNLKNAKEEATKKGIDALKKSANPFAKGAGYLLNKAQKKKEQKEEQENEEEKNEDDVNEDETQIEEEQQEKKVKQLLKKLLPVIMMVAPVLLIFLLLFTIASPIVTAYSWFTSLFHHKDADSSSYTVYSEKEEQNRLAEKNYNDAILGSSDGSVKGIVAEYQEKYGVTIDWYLLNALITYRYINETGDAYSNNDSLDLDEEELQKRLEELENSEETSTTDDNNQSEENSNSVDYSAALKKIQAFATLMVVKQDGSYVTDIVKDGIVYNNILNSETFKKYYKSLFESDTEEARRKLLDFIYDYADGAREIFQQNQSNSYYTSTGNYNGTSGLNEDFHYYQSDSEWKDLILCGSGDFSSNGCNITSAAMAISILTNQKITPAVLHSKQSSIQGCSPDTRPLMIMNFAKLYGLNATSISKKDTNAVTDMLAKMANGNTVVIVRLAINTAEGVRYYTPGGHYMAAVGVKTENGKNKLLIWDPAGKNKPERDNYWADLETDLMPYLREDESFIIISK